MRIAIIDDDALQLEILLYVFEKELKERYDERFVFDTFSSGDTFREKFDAGVYQLVIMNMHLQEETGIAVAKKIRRKDQNVKIIFCSENNDFAAESYQVDAAYYFKKPMFQKVVEHMFACLHIEELEKKRILTIKNNLKIRIQKLMYVSYHNHKVTFHMYQSEDLTSRMDVEEAMNLLKKFSDFHQISKSSIIQFAYVGTMNGTTVTMKDEKELRISRQIQKRIAEAYKDYQIQS